MRFFNTVGPCVEEWHYMLPAAERLPEVPRLIERGMYFGVHAPRQTGKTTTLMTVARQLTAGGRYAALHFSCEDGKIAGDDHVAGQRAVLGAIRQGALDNLPEALQPPDPWPDSDDAHLLADGLRVWARACPRPLVLFFDEIDALRGNSLLSVLSQLRDRYPERPRSAAWTVALCGLRDVRDYKAASGGDASRLGGRSLCSVLLDQEDAIESTILTDFGQQLVHPIAQRRITAGIRFHEIRDELVFLPVRTLKELLVAFQHGSYTLPDGLVVRGLLQPCETLGGAQFDHFSDHAGETVPSRQKTARR
jgi:hypothetical protein